MRRRARALAALVALVAADPVAAQEPAADCRPADLAALEGWNGVWIAQDLLADINGREPAGAMELTEAAKLIGLEAPWTPEGWKRMGAALRLGVSTTQAGWAFPVMMSSPAPFTIVISPTVTVIASQYREIRYVYTDGRPHAPEEERWPTNWGDSIGCWEGDTLTIDTVGVKYDPEFNFVAPPLSGNAHFVERIRMTGPDRLESEITITDPEYLERPWQVHMVYLRHPVLTRLVHESDIFANDRTQPGEGIVADAGPRAVLDPSYLPEKEPELTAEQLDRVAGRYAFNEQPLELVVERRGNRVVFKAPPALNFFLPLYARDPLNFVAVDGGTFRFLTDDRGRVIGFEGTNPAGVPMTGRRISR